MPSSAPRKPNLISTVQQPCLIKLTILAFQSSSRIALNACKTHKLAVIAFVVAIAGMMFPAISIIREITTSFVKTEFAYA